MPLGAVIKTIMALGSIDDLIKLKDLITTLINRKKVTNAEDTRSDSEKYKNFLAGIDLAGRKLKNNRIRAYGSNDIINEFPAEFKIGKNTYTLEDTKIEENGYVCAQYV